MLKLISISTIQSLFILTAQVFLKLAVVRMESFQFSWKWFGALFSNWHLICSGIAVSIGMLLWLYILRHFDFSVAYPLIGISYVFGVFAGIFVFHETVPITRWIGVLLIVAGVLLVAKQ